MAAIVLHRPGLPTAYDDHLIERVWSHNSPVRLWYLRAAMSLLVKGAATLRIAYSICAVSGDSHGSFRGAPRPLLSDGR